MCDNWINSFENFLSDVGMKPSAKHSLERINNDGHYEPGNVCWALRKQQNANRSTTFKVNGEHINVKKIAKELNIHEKTVKNLLTKAKYTIDEIRKYSTLTHYQKIEMGKSINNKCPFSLAELEKVKSHVLPSPKATSSLVYLA